MLSFKRLTALLACALYVKGGQVDEAALLQSSAKQSQAPTIPSFHPGAKQSTSPTYFTSLHHGPVHNGPSYKATQQTTAGKSSALKIKEDGVYNTYYLPGADVIDDGMTVKFLPPPRFYLMKTDTTDYSNRDNFKLLYLPGKVFEVDIDFGGEDGPGCGCNINFYMVNMPAATPGVEGDYYCDAQCFEGKGCCTEWDMNEGNQWAQQITNHACTGVGSYADHPDWSCNKWGDPENKIEPNDFGRGGYIDSTKKFTFRQRYEVSGGGEKLKVVTELLQGDKGVIRTMGPDNAQLNAMLKNLTLGMVYVTGYWGDSAMNWLDKAHCGEDPETCSDAPAYIGNFSITTIGHDDTPASDDGTKDDNSNDDTKDDDTECVENYKQCGGKGYTGPTQCCAGSSCTEQSEYYSQCL